MNPIPSLFIPLLPNAEARTAEAQEGEVKHASSCLLLSFAKARTTRYSNASKPYQGIKITRDQESR